MEELPLDPDLPIVDPHMHLWDLSPGPGGRPGRPAIFDVIARSGHCVTHSVFLECGAQHWQDGAVELRPVGEVVFANRVAGLAATDNGASCRVAHRIVGTADPLLGERVRPVLDAHIVAAGTRFRGLRFWTWFSETGAFGTRCDPRHKGLLRNPLLVDTARVLAAMDLSLDVWCFHSQLDEVIDLADAVPDLTIVLDHIGTPETQEIYAGREAEVRRQWHGKLAELARRPNSVVKLGGMGMDVTQTGVQSAHSELLAARWRPWVEDCIAIFGPARCMFESNFPPDGAAGSYGAIWNAFKRIAAGASPDEKALLFAGTASRIYRIDD